ncbi:MAG: DUF1801 domain-containing protein [Sedimentisphaerales bacterium]|nr:DUF1801 domain-containing protein [Sedimentisphaerales bacterium]
MNKEVEKYIKKQKSPQKEICLKLREIIIKTFPKIEEQMWAGVPFYDKRYYIVALKDHVNMGFAITGLSKEEIALFEGNGKTMRHIKFKSLDDIDEKQIVKLLKIAKKAKCTC